MGSRASSRHGGDQRLTHHKDLIADATRNERAHANGNDLLKPGVLCSTRLDILRDHEVVLLVWNRLPSQKAGSQSRNIGEISPLRHIQESTILSLPGFPRIDFTNTICSHEQPISTPRKNLPFEAAALKRSPC